jgi:cell division protease FtsH
MVTQLGYSDKLGTVAYADPQQEQFLGYSLGRQVTFSEATQQTIDAEVRRLVSEAYETAKRLLTEKRRQLDVIANALLEFETLTGDELKGLLEGKVPTREDQPPTTPAQPRGSVPSSPNRGETGLGGAEAQPA